MTKNTFVHGVEEWEGVPHRLRDALADYQVRLPDGSLLDSPQYAHKAPVPHISDNYIKLEEPLRALSLARDVVLGDANVIVTTARAVADLGASLLARDKDLFLTPDPVPAGWYSPAR